MYYEPVIRESRRDLIAKYQTEVGYKKSLARRVLKVRRRRRRKGRRRSHPY